MICNRHLAQDAPNPPLAQHTRRNLKSLRMLATQMKACLRQHLIRMLAPMGMVQDRNDSSQSAGRLMDRIGRRPHRQRKVLRREINVEVNGNLKDSQIEREGKRKMLKHKKRRLMEQGIQARLSKFSSKSLKEESRSLASHDSQREMESKSLTLQEKRQNP